MEIGNEVTIKWSMPGWMRREGNSTIFKGIVRKIDPEIITIIASAPECVKGCKIPIHRVNVEKLEVI